MPGMKGYGGKHTNDRRTSPGKVKSGRVTADAYGPQAPLGTVSLARKNSKKSKY